MPSDLDDGVQEHAANRELRDLRPDEVVEYRFGWRLRGVSRKQVRRLVLEIAAELDHTRRAWAREVLECRRLEKSLAATMPATQELRAQLTAVREQLKACTAYAGRPNAGRANARLADARTGQEDELVAAAPHSGGQNAAAERGVEEIATRARLRAETMIREAQKIAADTLRSARTVAQMRLRAADRGAPWGPIVGRVAHEELRRVAQTAERHLSDLITRVEVLRGTIGGRPRSARRRSRAPGTLTTRRSHAVALGTTEITSP